MTDNNAVLILDDSLLVGKGAERLCYRHPSDPNLCVKIKYKERKNKLPQNESDYDYFSYLKSRNICWDNITKCYGWVDTNKGRGLVFGFQADEDGNALESLEKMLDGEKISPQAVLEQIEYLVDYLVENKILVSDFHLSNMLYNPNINGNCKIVIIDGVGDRNFFTPIIQMSRCLVKFRINKKLARCRKLLRNLAFCKIHDKMSI
jgi:hypothetical protein